MNLFVGWPVVPAHPSKCRHHLHAHQFRDAQVRDGRMGHGHQRIPLDRHRFQRQKWVINLHRKMIYQTTLSLSFFHFLAAHSRVGLPRFSMRPKGFLHIDRLAVRRRQPLRRQHGRDDHVALCRRRSAFQNTGTEFARFRSCGRQLRRRPALRLDGRHCCLLLPSENRPGYHRQQYNLVFRMNWLFRSKW